MTLPAPLRAMRPHQWVKNLFVFAPLLFARAWSDPGKLGATFLTFGAFCAAASAIYLVNDVLDREADREHPKKRLRPIAAGTLSVPVALVMAVLLAAGAIVLGASLGSTSAIAAVIVTYLVVQSLYSWQLKHFVVLDVLCIASGFVLRLIAGGFAADVEQSQWILVCTIFLSLFLALCKRRHEVVALGDRAADHRRILADYPVELLDQLISALTAATIVGYTLYTVDDRTLQVHGLVPGPGELPVLLLTVPFVVYGLFRYLFLVHRRGGGGSPTTTLARDLPSMLNVVLFVVTALAILS